MTFRFALVVSFTMLAGQVLGCGGGTPSIDKGRLGAACGSGGSTACVSGQTCADYSHVDSSVSTAACVATQNPCDLVDCHDKRCSVDDTAPEVVWCMN